MKYCIKHVTLTIFATFMILTSCKKNKAIKRDEPIAPQPVEAKKYIPVKFETETYQLSLTYKEHTALLSEIKDSNGDKIVITYTRDQQLFKLEKYQTGSLLNVIYYEQPDNKNTSVAYGFEYEETLKIYKPSGSYNLTYNSENKINGVNYYDKRMKPVNAQQYFYNDSGNLIQKHLTTYPNTKASINYTYDQKTGICKYIAFPTLIALETEQWFFLSTVNNVLSALHQNSPLEDASFSYDYNENGYPSRMIVKSGNDIQQIKISYKQLMP